MQDDKSVAAYPNSLKLPENGRNLRLLAKPAASAVPLTNPDEIDSLVNSVANR